MPETAQLMSMFSELASTSPTPATTCSKLEVGGAEGGTVGSRLGRVRATEIIPRIAATAATIGRTRSEEHTSELQSQSNLVCRLLLEKKKTNSTKLITCLTVSSIASLVSSVTCCLHHRSDILSCASP